MAPMRYDEALYREMLVRWLRVRRDYRYNNEPEPRSPKTLARSAALLIFHEVERDFNRSTA